MSTNVATSADLNLTNEERIKLAKMRETHLRHEQYRAEAKADQAKADRMRLEGHDDLSRYYEECSDRAWRSAAELLAKYNRLALGRHS